MDINKQITTFTILINQKNKFKMNTYSKFSPNVFLAKCDRVYQPGEHIMVTTKYGKENECIVFNLVYQKENFNYYSIVRADRFNVQEWAKKRAYRLKQASTNAEQKSNQYLEASNEGRDFLKLGEPIKVVHHCEKRHRALIERNHNRMSKAVELSKVAQQYADKVSYWESKSETINLSMPESLEFYEFKLSQAKQRHEGLKNGSIKKDHSYSLTYSKKEVNDLEKKYNLAKKMWA